MIVLEFTKHYWEFFAYALSKVALIYLCVVTAVK